MRRWKLRMVWCPNDRRPCREFHYVLKISDWANKLYLYLLERNYIETRESLARREKEILARMIQGKLSKEIGEIQPISKQAVDSHRTNMLHKNNLTNTGELTGKAIRFRWL